MMESLQGKVAWVTGSSRGIGKATALMLAQLGCQLIICARTPSALENTKREITMCSGFEPLCLGYDVADSAQIEAAFRKVHAKFGRVDILVNNAGVIDDARLGMITRQQITNTLAVNTEAIIHHTQLVSRLMTRQQSGSVINVSSIMGRVGNSGQAVYAASKAAVIGITLSSAKELAGSGIRVNSVAPGFIDTDLTRVLPKEIYQQREASIKLGSKAGKPEDVANVIAFLASDLSGHVTGQVIGVDGGMLV